MIVLMGATTFITQKQMMARSGPMEGQQAQIQKIMLYVLPFSFAIFGFNFPIGVLLYWLTTNIWSMGQQFFVIRRMPVAVGGGGAAPASCQPVAHGPGVGLGRRAPAAAPAVELRRHPVTPPVTRRARPTRNTAASRKRKGRPGGAPLTR